MTSDFDAVGKFHEQFGLPTQYEVREPHLVPKEVWEFRLKFLQEELDELREGYEQEDLVKIADALVDLVYVALGTAHFHHLPWDELFSEVQRANLKKMRVKAVDDSKRQSEYDVVKPKGWTPPRIGHVLAQNGWPGPPLPFAQEESEK